MALPRTPFPCPPRCEHTGECEVATARRAEGGHTCKIIPAPKMDTPSLVAAVCSCGRWTSGPTSERRGRESWRQHADDKMGHRPGGDAA